MWVPGPSGPAGGCAVSRWRSCASGAVHRGTRGGTVFVKFMSPKYDKAGFQRLVIVGIPPFLSGRRDLNPRPLDPQSSALPNCATARWCKSTEKRIYHMTSITQNKRVATRVIPDYHLAIGRHQLHRRHGPSKSYPSSICAYHCSAAASRPTPDTPIMDTSAG